MASAFFPLSSFTVMAGLVPATHDECGRDRSEASSASFAVAEQWMAGTSPAMTGEFGGWA